MPHPAADEPQSEEFAFKQEFEQELASVERSLTTLKQRYAQVQQDQTTQAELQERQETLQQELRHHRSAEMQAELKRIETQLDELETSLESHLFTWGSLKESFWQIVRFSGLGIVVGWFLAFVVLQSPKPETSPPPPTPSTNSSPGL